MHDMTTMCSPIFKLCFYWFMGFQSEFFNLILQLGRGVIDRNAIAHSFKRDKTRTTQAHFSTDTNSNIFLHFFSIRQSLDTHAYGMT